MAGRNFLFVPGPTNVPDRVLRAMVVPQEDHRSPKFGELGLACINGLKKIFKTEAGTPFIFPASGTGCWEAALANCLNPGDKVLIARFGQFSHLWADMAARLGFQVEILETPWGEGAPIERYRAALAADTTHSIKAVLATQNETATGVNSNIPALRAAIDSVKHPALLMVDSVSALASVDFRMETSAFGTFLDRDLDALGTLIGVLLAIHYARLPDWYILAGIAYYLFACEEWWREKRGRSLHPLPASRYRRHVAVVQSVFIALALLPVTVLPKSDITAALVMIPVLAGFLRDWWIVAGYDHRALSYE